MTTEADPKDEGAAAETEGPRPVLSWDEFERRLTLALARMADETFLTLSMPTDDDGAGYYVQFAYGDTWGARAEAVGSHYLAPSRALTPAQEGQLESLAFQRPEPSDIGQNFFRMWPIPVPFEEVSRLAVRTLSGVFGIPAPTDLRYRYGAVDGRVVVEPDLGIEAERRTPPPRVERQPGRAAVELGPLVEEALKHWLGVDAVVRDADGDYPIRVGSALMFVRPLEGLPPVVRIFSPILHDIAESPALLAALSDLNARVRFGRVFWTARQVIVAMELTAVDITSDQVVFACTELGNLADHLDDVLRGRFGGSTMFETRPVLVN